MWDRILGTLSEIPRPIQYLVVVVIALVVFASAAYLLFGPRGLTAEDQAKRDKRAEAWDKRLASAKDLTGTDELSQLPTGELEPPRKLPGQDRLTRGIWTGPDISTVTVPAVVDDRSSGGTPTLAAELPPPLQRGDLDVAAVQPSAGGPDPVQLTSGEQPTDVALPAQAPATTAMPAANRPAVPGGPAAAQPAPPAPPTALIPAGETRAQRRHRLEALALEEAARQRDADRPPESP